MGGGGGGVLRGVVWGYGGCGCLVLYGFRVSWLRVIIFWVSGRGKAILAKHVMVPARSYCLGFRV